MAEEAGSINAKEEKNEVNTVGAEQLSQTFCAKNRELLRYLAGCSLLLVLGSRVRKFV